tara:strand:+ start:2235 stop:3158 length:924 start_codon:yes stop_codon:yes gene_type:complete
MLPLFEAHNVELYIKREDLIDSRLSGNKLYKLYGHLQRAQQLEAKGLASFGGYHSNHLHALAYAGAALGLNTKARIRGFQPNQLSPTLIDCQQQGMELEFGSRRSFTDLKQQCLEASEAATLDDRGYYWIPEGGGALEGSQGCRAIIAGIHRQADKLSLSDYKLCVPSGTGTTAAGLLSGLSEGDELYVYSALKLGQKAEAYKAEIEAQSGAHGRQLTLFDETDFGGFAKTKPELFHFMERFTASTGILLDPIYTAKMFYRIERQVGEGVWSSGDKIVAIHTGGLQGRRGFPQLMNNDTLVSTAMNK